MPENRNPSPARLRSRTRSSGVDAAAVRRLAAGRQSPAHRPSADRLSADQPSDGRRPADQPSGARATAVTEADADEAVIDETAAAETVIDETVSGKAASGATGVRKRSRRRPRIRAGRKAVLVLLTVVTLVLGGLAAWFGTEAGAASSVPSAQNRALSDPAETSQVTAQVTGAIVSLFSYNYANPNATSTASGKYLTGAAVKQYNSLFATLRKDGPAGKLVVTSSVSNIGVELLTKDTARVLIFLTENEGSAGDTTPESLGAMLAVNAVRTGGTWKISGIDTFTS